MTIGHTPDSDHSSAEGLLWIHSRPLFIQRPIRSGPKLAGSPFLSPHSPVQPGSDPLSCCCFLSFSMLSTCIENLFTLQRTLNHKLARIYHPPAYAESATFFSPHLVLSPVCSLSFYQMDTALPNQGTCPSNAAPFNCPPRSAVGFCPCPLAACNPYMRSQKTLSRQGTWGLCRF